MLSHKLAAFLILEELLIFQAGSDLNTQLVEAVKRNDYLRAESLLGRGAEPNSVVSHGETVLMLGAELGSSRIVKLLISKKARLDQSSFAGHSALDYAVATGHFEIAKLLLSSGARVEGPYGGFPPLIVAADAGSYNGVLFVLNNGGHINSRDPITGETALIYAARRKRINIIRLLSKRHADPSLKDNAGETALSIAKNDRSRDIVRVLEHLK